MEDDMLNDFYIEAQELYAEAEDALLEVERTEDFETTFNSIFRAFHSVKGAAGMFGLNQLQEHMHYLENLLDQKKPQGFLSPVLVDYFLLGIDTAKKITDGESVDFKYYDPDQKEAPQKTKSDKEADEVDEDNFIEKIKLQIISRKKNQNLPGHIYVVDDEEDILTITKALLENQDYKVSCFLNAPEALKTLKTDSPDLVITDIRMPEMNGIEFMQEINKIMPQLPVIVASGYVTKDVAMDSLACGVSGILEKPYDTDVLERMVALGIERYRAFKLLNKSLDLIVYQFEDFDKFLLESGMETKRKVLRDELKMILKQKKILVDV